jgi:hypothetical protein
MVVGVTEILAEGNDVIVTVVVTGTAAQPALAGMV